MYTERIYHIKRLIPKKEWEFITIQELKFKYKLNFFFFNNTEKVFFKHKHNQYFIAEKLKKGYHLTEITKK